MNREPLGLYIFRFVVGLGLLLFMAMLYWSSLLLEDNVRAIRVDLGEIKSEVLAASLETQRVREEVLQIILDAGNNMPAGMSEEPSVQSRGRTVSSLYADRQLRHREHVDQSLPNILEEDPYYTKVLPEQLGRGFRPLGMRRMATTKPNNLHPFIGMAPYSSFIGMCNVSVAQQQFGKYETLAPNMALKLEERVRGDGKKEFWVHLRDGVYWQPLNPAHLPSNVALDSHFLRKHKVTAHDFKFHLDVVMNPYVQNSGAVALRNYLEDIEELRVIDDLTFVVRWKREEVEEDDGTLVPKIKYIARGWTGALQPLARFVYQYFPDGKKIVDDGDDPDAYRIDSVWAQNFAEHWAKNIIVSCGAWIFDGMTDESLRFKRNPDYYHRYAVLVEGMEIAFYNSPDTIWQSFKAGKLDTHSLRPTQLVELEQFESSPQYVEQSNEGLAIHRMNYTDRAFNYIGWNQAKPFFEEKKVRRAMTMAIDRNRIITQNLNEMGVAVTGPAFVEDPAYDPTISAWPYDPAEARKLLEEEGWYDSDGDGVRDKLIDGARVPFRFKLSYYVKNPTSKVICEYITTALKEVGVDCDLNGSDIADLTQAFNDKSFDAIYFGWALGTPPGEPKQIWHSRGAKEKGSSNAIGFANSEVDRIIAKLQYEYNQDDRNKLYHRFHQIIHDEAPYTFLYSPKTVMLSRDYVQNLFIPKEHQDLIPGATVSEPDLSVIWLKSP
ncbi:permease [Simkania negevensis]|uniref:Permease n=1 Tax=Simkania negevensis TaxID=83561 RepID=A0ABS3AQF3_9BACT|nr:permease [Simkania negevensis]